ncbi:MAG: hypothetical protein LBD63_00295 [Mycoplasmataceae bacterium]|nr:hypothetical protein [Mycoplasmataceae bacterium]
MLKFNCKYINAKKDPLFFFKCLKLTSKGNVNFSYDKKSGNYLVEKVRFQPFIFKPELIDGISENFYEKILKIILSAHDKAVNLETENTEELTDCSLQHQGELESLIHSVMQGIQYQNYDILDFVVQIVYKITTKQIWKNGNKRTAIVTAAKLFRLFGLFLFFSNKDTHYLEYWRYFIKTIAKRYEDMRQGKSNEKEEDIITDIKKQFIKSLHLNLQCIN